MVAKVSFCPSNNSPSIPPFKSIKTIVNSAGAAEGMGGGGGGGGGGGRD